MGGNRGPSARARIRPFNEVKVFITCRFSEKMETETGDVASLVRHRSHDDGGGDNGVEDLIRFQARAGAKTQAPLVRYDHDERDRERERERRGSDMGMHGMSKYFCEKNKVRSGVTWKSEQH